MRKKAKLCKNVHQTNHPTLPHSSKYSCPAKIVKLIEQRVKFQIQFNSMMSTPENGPMNLKMANERPPDRR